MLLWRRAFASPDALRPADAATHVWALRAPRGADAPRKGRGGRESSMQLRGSWRVPTKLLRPSLEPCADLGRISSGEHRRPSPGELPGTPGTVGAVGATACGSESQRLSRSGGSQGGRRGCKNRPRIPISSPRSSPHRVPDDPRMAREATSNRPHTTHKYSTQTRPAQCSPRTREETDEHNLASRRVVTRRTGCKTFCRENKRVHRPTYSRFRAVRKSLIVLAMDFWKRHGDIFPRRHTTAEPGQGR